MGLFCYERDILLSLSDHNMAAVIEAINSISRYLDDLLQNIDNPWLDKYSILNFILKKHFFLN